MKKRARFTVALAVSLGALGAGGCAGQVLEGQADGISDLAGKARQNGAYNCAPRQLAMAETYVDLARNDLHDGNYFEAKDELAVADENAKDAFRLSPKEQCNPDVAIKPPPPIVRIERKDTDGDGIPDDVDKCPTQPEDKDGFEDADGCPDPDNDKDGIPDVADKCPNEPEDKDGFEDADGCPDPDNDQDGIPDTKDKCPNQPEDKDGFEDADGCPDPDNDKDGIPDVSDKCPNEPGPPGSDGCPQKYKSVVITRSEIKILQQVFFDTDKARIKPVSYPLLDEVAQAILDHPELQQIEVQGHTDSRGSRRHNLKLSQDRANSVMKYLVKKGVDAARLTAKGYGPDVPLADNRTAAGRAQNRRVQFIIAKQESP